MALLKRHDVYYFFVPQNGMGRSGIPDIVGCYRGLFFAVECKAGRNKPTPLQIRELSAIYDHEGAAFVINEENIHELEQWILQA